METAKQEGQREFMRGGDEGHVRDTERRLSGLLQVQILISKQENTEEKRNNNA